MEGVCFCVDAEDQKSACIIQREDKPMCITSLDAVGNWLLWLMCQQSLYL